MIYNSLIKCHLEYCLPVWGNCCASLRRIILSMQKQAVRNIVNSKYNSHTDPLFKSLEILKFSDLIEYNSATFIFNLAYNLRASGKFSLKMNITIGILT